MRYKIKRITYNHIDLSPDDLITIADAAALLNLTLSGLRSKLDRGELAEIIDTEAPHGRHHRRFLLRREVEDEAFAKRSTA